MPHEKVVRSGKAALVAFVSGVFAVPLVLFLGVRLLFPNEALGTGSVAFWSIVLIGSVIAAAIAYLVKRLPVGLAALLGPVTVIMLLMIVI